MNFFHLIFPRANIFLYFARPPPPISFLMVRPLPWAAWVILIWRLEHAKTDNKLQQVCTVVMHQSIETTAPRPQGLSGECNISEI